jgi:hypothetical protein
MVQRAAAEDLEPNNTAAPLEPEQNPLPKGQLVSKVFSPLRQEFCSNDTPEPAAYEPPTETTAC